MKRVAKGSAFNLQLRPNGNGEPAQPVFTARSQMQQNLASVLFAVLPRHCSLFFKPVNQLHCAVMTQAQPVRNRCHRRSRALRQPPDREQKLVLLRLQAVRPRSLFAKVQKLPDPEAKLGQLAVVGCGNLSSPYIDFGSSNAFVYFPHTL